MPTVSIIIPTHNRSAALARTLTALSQQTYPIEQMEVVIVADGCSDDTVEMLHRYQAPFALQVIDQPGQGPAVARNQGAAKATAPLLIFVDDDIEVTTQFVAAHVRAHEDHPNRVVIGYLPTILATQTGFFRITLRGWWEAMFQQMREVDHRFAYTDLLSGNFSVPTQLFNAIDGFDANFRCHEDYELGLRLLKAGADFGFAPDAMGYHHELTDINRSLNRKFQEGIADVQLGQKHPELKSTLLVCRLLAQCSLLDRMIILLIFKLPILGDFLAGCARQILDVLEGLRLRHYWRSLLDRLLGYWYLRGIAKASSLQQALQSFLQADTSSLSNLPSLEIEIDLADGFDQAEQQVDQARPTAIRLRYGSQIVGRIPPKIGVERLRGIHLRAELTKGLAKSCLSRMMLERGWSQVSTPLQSANCHPQPLEVIHVN
ncbi:MAG: glycosyltransferase [Scytolyngbya sp. HA4215-MV1]|nr:glycosyltransferase [Scytolyngbya sp. HA4215-MV1]